MAKIIKLKYPGRCADCGARLPVGSRAKWYGRGRVYGLDCHGDSKSAFQRGDRSPGAIASHYDRYGVYTPDGSKIGSTCGCIDYPCCGH